MSKCFSEVEQPTKPKGNWKEDTISFIADFEGFKSESYWDSKQWSIGYGTKSYKGEVITEGEAKQRKLDHLQPLIELVDTDCYNDNQKIALVSYMYNVGVNAMSISSYVKGCDIDSIKYIMSIYGWSINGVPSNGLAKRRNIELNKFKG